MIIRKLLVGPKVSIIYRFTVYSFISLFHNITVAYRIHGLCGGDINLANLVKIAILTVHHYKAIYTASMSVSTCSTELKPPPIVLFEQIAKYLYSIYIAYNKKISM